MRKPERILTLAILAAVALGLWYTGANDQSVNDALAAEGGHPGLYHGTAVAADVMEVE